MVPSALLDASLSSYTNFFSVYGKKFGGMRQEI